MGFLSNLYLVRAKVKIKGEWVTVRSNLEKGWLTSWEEVTETLVEQANATEGYLLEIKKLD